MPKQKILLVQLGRIGDLILMTAMFKVLKETIPGAEIHLLASRNNHHFASKHPYVDKVYVYTKGILSTLVLLHRLKKEKYDFWIDPKDHYSRESHWFASLARAKQKIGYNRPGKPPAFDLAVKSQETQYHDHAAKRNMKALSFLDLENADPRPVLFLDQDSETALKDFLSQQGISGYHCINISAGKDIRYWPQENWIALLSKIAIHEQSLLIIGDARDAKLAEEIVEKSARAKYYPTPSLVDVFSVIKHADLVVTPDTSIVHIAAAFDRPALGLYSNHEWNYKKFHPLSTHYRMVVNPVPEGLVKDIPLDLVLKNYEDLSKELNNNR
jgi:ADP-heptose:LPS heptosyltransferase